MALVRSPTTLALCELAVSLLQNSADGEEKMIDRGKIVAVNASHLPVRVTVTSVRLHKKGKRK